MGGGGGGIINTKNNSSYDIRLSIYNDGVRPVETKRRLEVEEKLQGVSKNVDLF